MKKEEESTFHESKEYFKLVKERLRRIVETPITVTTSRESKNVEKKKDIVKKKAEILRIKADIVENKKDISNKYTDASTPLGNQELVCKILDQILFTVNFLTVGNDHLPHTVGNDHLLHTGGNPHLPHTGVNAHSSSLCTMNDIQRRLEILLQTINDGLRKSNDVVYNVLYRMDAACREIILNNSDLLEIIQKILLKFCEVSDMLDFDQSESTINALFDMSKMIYIYKNKLNDIMPSIVLDREYKRKRFGFYYTKEVIEEETLMMESLPYTDWSSWIGTFTEEKGESFEGTPVKKKCLRKANDVCKVVENTSPCITLESLGGKVVPFGDLPKEVKKIGEASFSEVFKAGNDVYKIIPLGQEEGMTPYDVFLREAYIQKVLSKEKGVCALKGVLVAKGPFSPEYLQAWDAYGVEENERPSKYGEDQTYGILVMEDAGIPLEKYSFGIQKNMVIFIKSLVRILSRLERTYEFEHRDLHWGNVMISKGKINIIDFTLSRVKVDGRVFYNNLSQYTWLFQGDASVDEQFEIYRRMRDACGGDWSSFSPSSNFFWIEYIVNKSYSKMKRIRDTNLKNRLLGILKECKTIRELEKKLKDVL